jgi:hypothetical protein
MSTVDVEPGDRAEAPVLDLDRPVILHALTFLDEGDDVTVGRRDIDSYCVLPADGARLLRELDRGASPRSVAQWYAETYGQPVDMVEFLAAMDELGFLASAGEVPTSAEPVRWQRLGRAVFSPAAWLVYAALLVAAVAAMSRHHDLLPNYRNLFFTQYITLVILVMFFGQVPFLLLHESFHMFAGRRLGLRSRLGIGRRLYYVVFETSLDGLVMVPRRKRYLPILAGMFADLLVIAVLTLIAAALRRPDGSHALPGAICLALAFGTLMRFFWQFYLYLETDLYQVVVTVTGCVDLQTTARRMVANRVNRLLGRRDRITDESSFHPRDRAVARWYSWLLVVGYGFSLGVVVLAAVPAVIQIFSTVLGRLADDHLTLAGLTDSVVFLLVNLAEFTAFGVVVLRDRRRRRRTATSPSSTDLEER